MVRVVLGKEFQHIILYGIILGAFVFVLKWLQWKYFVADHSVEIYVGMVALLFTGLGIWIAHKLIQPQSREVIVEREVFVPVHAESSFDEEAWKQLGLTTREDEVLQLLVRGYSNAEIARTLYLSVSTVKTHAYNLYQKMEVSSRIKAIDKARELRIIRSQEE
ncbi:MAG TPA: response regulator transcription factor [Membranihabitans sp.]|nr:response regulator transcription factor [Membranihabitans sp.]